MDGSPWALKFRAPFFPCVPGIRISCSYILSYKLGRERLNIRVKNNKFRAPFDQKGLCCKIYHKSAHFSILHTDAHDRLDDISTHQKPHFPQITNVFKPSHNMVRCKEERFAMVRMATRGFGAKKIATTLGLPQSTTKQWLQLLQRLRSDGEMVSKLHFVEPVLKINNEEWIKVTDEYTMPNCAALMELGRKFLLILDNVPSHASRLALEHNKTVWHGTVEFQPPCSPDLSLSLLDFFLWNELKVQLVQHPCSCQSRRIAGTFDSRVSQNVDRQP